MQVGLRDADDAEFPRIATGKNPPFPLLMVPVVVKSALVTCNTAEPDTVVDG
jgi:hypothetical protein